MELYFYLMRFFMAPVVVRCYEALRSKKRVFCCSLFTLAVHCSTAIHFYGKFQL